MEPYLRSGTPRAALGGYQSGLRMWWWCRVVARGLKRRIPRRLHQITAAPTPQFQMTMDQPFFYVIRDDDTGALLFIGTVVAPGQ
jgi:hypothetical protein